MVKIRRKKLYPAFLFPFSIFAAVVSLLYCGHSGLGKNSARGSHCHVLVRYICISFYSGASRKKFVTVGIMMMLGECKWIMPSEKGSTSMCAQQRLRSACASSQPDQILRCALYEWSMTLTSFMQSVNGVF